MKKLFLSVFAVALLAGTAAFAHDLGTFKGQGYIGERPDGYVGVVSNDAPAAAKAVAADINSKRKAEYKAIADKNNQPLEVVEKVAGDSNIAKTKSGNYIMDASGTWIKK